MKTVTSGANFFKFDEKLAPEFKGKMIKPVIREKDGEDENQKAGSVMGYEFMDVDGELHIIGNSHAIEKAVKDGSIKPGDFVLITFKGKTTNRANKPVNVFKIDLFDDEAEFLASFSSDKE